MFGLTVQDIASVCNGRLSTTYHGNEEIQRIVVDSRSAQKGDLFVAYKGNNVDGHDFILNALENGATAALSEKEINDCGDKPVIFVKDTQTAIESIMSAFRLAVDCPVIGITGSVGKTTTKEMISSVLATRLNVCKTDKNLNNLIGVPRSLSCISEDTDVAVIEMGISIPGEMDRLAKMVQPSIMVFTSIGHAHLEYLKNLEGVFKEKTNAIHYMYEDATVIANGDDPYLRKISCKQNLIFFGTSKDCQVRAENITINDEGHTSFDILHGSSRIHIEVPVYGRHLVNASLAAAAVGFSFGLSEDNIKEGIGNYQVVGRRGAVVNTGSITLVDDCYNSNLDSCKMSLQSLMDLPGRHVAILGDFLEQGDQSHAQHVEIGEYARNLGFDLVIGIGEYGSCVSNIHFPDNVSILPELTKLIQKDDVVLVKASKGVHLEVVADALKIVKL